MKWVWWGVDVNRKRYVHTIKARFIIRSGDAKVFYDRQTMESLLEQGISRHGSFVANNTVLVAEAESLHAHPVKRSFINVGSLLPRKQNEVLIAVFKRVRARTGKDLELVLIGDGPERQRLSELVRESELGGAVKILPKIEDPKLLKEYYREAIASVSFGQAGLAVLQSMAFGVPFVTKKNAISGGEINNIVSGENGILCEDSVDALEEAMSSLVLDQELARRLGAGAHSYYVNHASMDGMVSGFLQAIDWAMSRG
jgi:glycosyltransferase involved in cell wall biosynthesis